MLGDVLTFLKFKEFETANRQFRNGQTAEKPKDPYGGNGAPSLLPVNINILIHDIQTITRWENAKQNV